MTPKAPPLSRLASGSLRFYLKTVSPFLRPALDGPAGQSWTNDPEDFQRFREVQRHDGPAIYVLWIADHVNLLSLSYVSEAFRRVAHEFRFFADDSFGGHVMRSALRDVGAEVLPISQSNPAERLKLLRRFMQERPSAFLAVDGRGPYFKVGTGLPHLAIAVKATIVPCSIVSKPRLQLSNGRGSVALPLPGSAILAAFGNPLTFEAQGHNNRAVTFANEIERALHDLRRRAIEKLSGPR